MYRDDDAARAERASSLIDEISDLERQRLTRVAAELRLEAAKRELATLQARPAAPGGPGTLVHLFVFGATAGVAYLGYTLLI